MVKSKRQRTQQIEEVTTQIAPVVSCSDTEQINVLMEIAGVLRAETYNVFGSLRGWGITAMSSPDKKLRSLYGLHGLDKSKKLHEWQCLDAIKLINAQQSASKTLINRKIWQKYPLTQYEKNRQEYALKTGLKGDELLAIHPKSDHELSRSRLFHLLDTNPTGDPWLHRQFRTLYRRGHTYKRNQIVWQGQGYTCKRINRHSVQLEVSGIDARRKISLKVRCRQLIKGQIRLIKNERGLLEVHFNRKRSLTVPVISKYVAKIGLDKGYTEAFYTSEGDVIALGLGKLMTKKTERIARTNRNRYRLRSYAQNVQRHDPKKAATILEKNLGYKVKSRKLQREKATLKNFIRRDIRRVISEPFEIVCEDLSSSISGSLGKRMNRRLNQWMKSELQLSIEKIALETGSKVSVVNPAYTSQLDSLLGVLLGARRGDKFIRISGDVIQADYNASLNIRARSADTEITRFMKTSEVLDVLLNRTIRYLHSLGKTVGDAIALGWMETSPKLSSNENIKKRALQLECIYLLQG
ncbi:MAG: hypothetical protein N5P05_003864 [Chroococcopsis gigantea SAG 12.99]|jgi:IS605 OrfB family transposase|nr:IS200/IS605 family accessory protein TnpB-related protein [Chlorogloea purpurea SAG 13.99]MDV3002258.1 hypothetical protein [Chroococcopsis gigantea SAG 12.99]